VRNMPPGAGHRQIEDDGPHRTAACVLGNAA
jgi:hypothetical protein